MKAINGLVQSIKNKIMKDMSDVYSSKKGYDLMISLLKAHNDYQESGSDGRDGADYIYNITDKNDLLTCVKGGMTAKQISELYDGYISSHTCYFFFSVLYDTPKPIWTLNELAAYLTERLDTLITDIVAYPYAYDSYREIYTRYVTNVILDSNDKSPMSDLDALEELKRKLNEK